MSTENNQAGPVILKAYEPTATHRVLLLDNGFICVRGSVVALTRGEALKIAYALMSAGAQT